MCLPVCLSQTGSQNVLVGLASYTTIIIVCTLQQTDYGGSMESLNISGEDVLPNEVYMLYQSLNFLTLSVHVQHSLFAGHDNSWRTCQYVSMS